MWRALGKVLRLESDLGQPEVENLGVAALGHENIRRLDVAVNDACGMSSVECVGNLDSKRQHSLDFQGLSADAMLQGHPVQ